MKRKHLLTLIILTLATCAGYLLLSLTAYRIGFPLDDAWIHQTYARSLAQGRGWEYIPGEQSAGSTSPLWTVLLAVGYLFRLAPYIWTFLLGALTLLALGITGEIFARRALPNYAPLLPVVGGFLCLEWHLVWAALSGMETLLSGLITTLVLTSLIGDSRRWLFLGLVTGLAVWIRPDGITLVGPVIFTIVFARKSIQAKLDSIARFALGFGIPLGAYLALNLQLSGNAWPNTYYAKQAEYAVLQEIPFLTRYLNEVSLPLVGAGLVLLPGAIWFIYQKIKDRDVGALAGVLWWSGYLGLYAWRLPVTYQHGRYVMPAMPIYFLWGLVGLLDLASRMRAKKSTRLAGAGWVMLTAALLVVFGVVGANAYAKDVAVIESEVVDPARWIEEHTEPGSLVAAHDIGALGYFGKRRILDLAGLISPEIIPVMRNANGLRNTLSAKKVDYLVLTLGWYPELEEGRTVVFQSSAVIAPMAGIENSKVVRWNQSEE